jgi:WD40 repeat protein
MTPPPYKGLIPYAEEDAPFFFGRDTEQDLIIANVTASRLTLLFGASGVGKSSLLRAGVAHQLRRAASQRLQTTGSPESAVVVFSSWRDDPVASLAEAISASVRQAWDAASDSTAADHGATARRTLVDTVQASADFVEGDLVVILDQFEEYFLYHAHEDGDGSFAVEFPRAVSTPGLRASFLVAIREDALAKLDHFEGRIPNLFANYLRVEHLDRAAAREAIEQPIRRYNLACEEQAIAARADIEPALVEAVLDEVKIGQVLLGDTGRGAIDNRVSLSPDSTNERIETPYLQLVMTRLWSEDGVDGRHVSQNGTNLSVLRLETLRRLGGAERIVRTHLDTTMEALTAREREVAAQAFHYLVTPSGTKIAHSVTDIAQYAALPEADIAPVLEKLSASGARVLLPVAPPLDRPTVVRYEIFHDVLAAAILDWRTRFAEAQRLDVQKAASEERLGHERRRVWRLRFGLAGVSVLLLGVVALAVFAFQQSESARTAQRLAFSREVAATAVSQLASQPDLSLLLALEAARITPSVQTENALRTILLDPVRAIMRGHTDQINSATYSPDGNLVVTASRDGTARVWDAHTGRLAADLRGHTREVTGAAFSPDGRLIVTASEDNTARVWEPGTGRQLTELRGHRIGTSGAFSPDSRQVVTSSDTTARVWMVDSGQPVAELRGHTGFMATARFSPDGGQVVTASRDGTARIWDAATGQTLADLRGHTGPVESAAFDAHGKQVVTASRDATARIWDAASGKLVAELRGHTGPLTDAVFSPNGKVVATAGEDGSVRVWDATSGRRLAQLRGDVGSVTSIAFSSDGRFLVTGSADKVAQVWHTGTEQRVAELRGHTRGITSVAFDPGGRYVISASQDGTARTWEVASTQHLAELRGHSGWVTDVMFSPDGTRVLTASLDGTARLWEATGSQLLVELRGHTGVIASAMFSHDGGQIVTASDDRTARIWDTSSGQLLNELKGHTGFVNSAAFSPDGKQVLTASWDDTARQWDASTGQTLIELRGHTGSVDQALFSPGGRQILTVSRDRTARVWEPGSGRSLLELVGHSGPVVSAAFSGDGARIVTASADGTARIWEASTGRALTELRGHVGELTVAVFRPGGNQVLTASEDGTARLWDARSGQAILELRGHAGPVVQAAFSPDGKFIVTASEDQRARVWETATGHMLAELRGHSKELTGVAFGPDSMLIATASRDGTARVYRCQVCGSMDDLLRLARTRATRALSPDERARFLDEAPPSAGAGR